MKDLLKQFDGNPDFVKTVREIVRRIAKVARPEKIILFGSSIRGNGGSAGDIDLLVVKRIVKRRQLAGRIYKALIGVGRAVDIIVATPEDIERYKDSPSLVIYPALQEGKVIYAA